MQNRFTLELFCYYWRQYDKTIFDSENTSRPINHVFCGEAIRLVFVVRSDRNIVEGPLLKTIVRLNEAMLQLVLILKN